MSQANEMRGLFARWKRTDQSLRAFGKSEDIAYSKLLYWRKKLGADARRDGARSKSAASSKLVPVRIVPNTPSSRQARGRFEIQFSNGTSLGVPQGFDDLDLRRIVDVLSAC